MSTTKDFIDSGKAVLGIEFGSTRIKAVLVDNTNKPIAAGSHDWENRLENGIWTYSLEDIWGGLQDCYCNLVNDVKEKYNTELTQLAAIGFSAMMHGYLAFDKEDRLLVPFRTWRNGITGQAATELTELFHFNIPQRWSIAHLYQAVLNQEEHVKDIFFLTTLAGYIHWKLTGQKVLGVGDASGMFPINAKTGQYDADMLAKFDSLVEPYHFAWKLEDLLPTALNAGESAGVLTEDGAKLLDPTGKLQAGCPLAPPEGDAGTGMVATNSVARRTGNVSAGTSIFGMVVLEDALQDVYPEIDMVATPDGAPVAMVHANNCTSDLDAWVGMFQDCLKSFGLTVKKSEVYDTLYYKALEGDADCGGLLSYGYLSGENITAVEEGRPLLVRTPKSNFNLANLMRATLFSTLGALKIGMDILLKKEKVQIDTVFGHGGLFKTEGVGQNFLAAAIHAPVSVMETAGEGGPWGMALLASYMVHKQEGEALQDYLATKVFADSKCLTVEPTQKDMDGMEAFIERYQNGLPVERLAGSCLV